MFVATQRIGFGGQAAAAVPITVPAVAFDGTNDYLTRGAGLTGAADSKTMTGSIWALSGADGVVDAIIFSTGNAFALLRQSTNRAVIEAENAAGTGILDIGSSTNSMQVADGWIHILFSVDLADATKRHLYINGVSDLAVVTYTDDTIDFTVADWAIGATTAPANILTGDLAQLWFAPGQYIDLSYPPNRRKFRSLAGKPVDLGADGSLPTGVAPLIYFNNAVASWQTNLGTGGGFTENGALGTAWTSPSD